MEVLRSLTPLVSDCAVCLGAFDGFHLGHQRLVRRARQFCEHVAVVTFEPHPAHFLAPQFAPPLLQSLEQRAECCRDLGIHRLILIPFNKNLAELPAEEFVNRILIHSLKPRRVVVGEDFRYGVRRCGDTRQLGKQLLAAKIDFEAITHELIDSGPLQGTKIGSTQIRQCLQSGNVAAASALLGRSYTLRGRVVHGDKRGRELGFPTANVEGETLVPYKGVYAVYMRLVDNASNGTSNNANRRPEFWPAVAHIGERPTFVAKDSKSASLRSQPIVEVHAIGGHQTGDLYGKRVEIVFVERIRDEQSFSNVQALRQAIAQDIEQSQKHLNDASSPLLQLPNLCNLEQNDPKNPARSK